MRLRKLAALLAMVLCVAIVATGCARQQEPAGDGGGQQEEEIGNVTVMGVWGGTELEAFEQVAEGWEQETGGSMQFEGTRDLSPILRARVQGGNPPDVAILPNPAIMSQFTDQLKPLDEAVDEATLGQEFSQQWIDQGKVDGRQLGVVIKAAPKSTVWYNPKRFADQGYQVPTTYEELVALSDRMRGEGGVAPWSVGMEAGGASGWAGSDWIQEIYLAESGPEMYDQWVSHEIPWTDPSVKSAFEKFGDFVTAEGAVPGGAEAIVSTTPEDASYQPFQDPPRANMYFLGAFAQGFISAQFPDLQPVEDYDFFDFPTINTQYQSPATMGGDVIVMFNDTPSARSFVNYMAKGASWQSWIDAGGFISPSQSIDASSYPDPLSQKVAQQVIEADPVRFDADDLMPAEVQQAFWRGILEYVQNPGQIDRILQDIESTAAEAYEAVEEPAAGSEEASPNGSTETSPAQ